MKTTFSLAFLLGTVRLWGQAPQLVVPVAHTLSITSVAFSPDGKYILTGSSDKTAKLWTLDGQEVRTFAGHSNAVSSVAFSPDGRQVLTGGEDDKARLWTLDGQEVLTFSGHRAAVSAVAFSLDGRQVLTGSRDRTAKLWTLDGQVVRTFAGHSAEVNGVAISPDGRQVLTGSRDLTAKLWTVDGQEVHTFSGHSDWVYSVKFSPDGQQVLTGSYGMAKLWMLDGQEVRSFAEHSATVYTVAFSSDGRQVLTGSSNRTAKLWTLGGQEVRTFSGHSDAVYAVAFSPDGRQVLSGSSDKTAKLWTLEGQEVRTFIGHSNRISAVAFSPGGRQVLTGSPNRPAKLWTLDGQEVRTFAGYSAGISAVAFSPDGQLVLTGSGNKMAKLWTLDGQEVRTFSGHSGAVFSVAFSPDEQWVLTGSGDDKAKLWTLDGQEVRTFSGHKDWVRSVAFSPDSQQVLTGSDDQTAKLWTPDGQEMRTFSGHKGAVYAVAFSPDGRQVLTGSDDQTAKLWTPDGQEVRTFDDHSAGLYGSIRSVAFSPDGRQVLTGSMDGTTKLWTLDGQKVRTFSGHRVLVYAVAFSPDGKHVLTGSLDNTTKLWDTKSGNELATLIAIDSTDWVVTTPSGLFDASPGAMNLMHYVVGLEVIDLEQLKDRYYEPGLLAKVMGFAEGGLRPVGELNNVALYPAITKAELEGDRLRVELEVRSGGIGKVVLLLNNNIELDANANPDFKTAFEVDLNRFASYFFPDSVNHLSLRTYNRDGWLKSQPYRLEYRPAGLADKNMGQPATPLSRREQQLDSINLYALVVGTSHYRGEQLGLNYPDKDATAFAEALHLAGRPLFGKNIEIKLLTTAAEPWPRKTEIARAMRDIAAKADPNDILLVYFSGHGITYPPNSEKGQFYYLTTDIASDKLDDPVLLATSAIAQDTLQEWIRQVKARKRILILDACNSGRVVERLEPGAKDLNSDQRRALERMKDRSGLFVMAGSAADKSSFEASRFGHGLLTYSLLNNMPLVAAANKDYIDVGKLFGNVREEVPRLAKEIGRIQDPELIGAESFDIGIINDTVHIVIPEAKPVFVRTVFIDSQRNKDLAHLGAAVNDYLALRASEKEPAVAYWAIEEFAGDHYYLGGQYQQNGETVSGKATLYRADKELTSFSFSGEKNALGRLAEEIVVEVFGYLIEHQD